MGMCISKPQAKHDAPRTPPPASSPPLPEPQVLASQEDQFEAAMRVTAWRCKTPEQREKFKDYMRKGEAGHTPAPHF